MNREEAIDKWIDALRSGKYRQGSGHLWQIDNMGNHCHCCLGVLLEEVSPESRAIQPSDWDVNESCQASLSSWEKEKYGISFSPDNDCNDFAGHLINMNDKQKKSFAEIADFIEEHKGQILGEAAE